MRLLRANKYYVLNLKVISGHFTTVTYVNSDMTSIRNYGLRCYRMLMQCYNHYNKENNYYY